MVARIEEPPPPHEQERLIGMFRRFQEATAFAHEHHDEILSEYAERWIAVAPEGVVASSPTWAGLKAELQSRGMDASNLDVTFVTSKTYTLILSR